MKNVHFIILIIGLLLAALAISFTVEYIKEAASEEFLEYGQYEPQYIEYDDYAMLKACEAYDLVYDYEEAVCTKGQQYVSRN